MAEDLTQKSDEELEEDRRAIVIEKERRQRVATGREEMGRTAREYAEAAGIDLSERNPRELGQMILDNLPRNENAEQE